MLPARNRKKSHNWDLNDDNSTLLQAMASYCTARSKPLPGSMLTKFRVPYDVNRGKWVNGLKQNLVPRSCRQFTNREFIVYHRLMLFHDHFRWKKNWRNFQVLMPTRSRLSVILVDACYCVHIVFKWKYIGSATDVVLQTLWLRLCRTRLCPLIPAAWFYKILTWPFCRCLLLPLRGCGARPRLLDNDISDQKC